MRFEPRRMGCICGDVFYVHFNYETWRYEGECPNRDPLTGRHHNPENDPTPSNWMAL